VLLWHACRSTGLLQCTYRLYGPAFSADPAEARSVSQQRFSQFEVHIGAGCGVLA
jgi:hypothetical protein